MSSSHETACHVIMYLNVELELALVAIQKCLVLLHDYLGPNTKKLWLHKQTNRVDHAYMVIRILIKIFNKIGLVYAK